MPNIFLDYIRQLKSYNNLILKKLTKYIQKNYNFFKIKKEKFTK